MAFSPSFKTLFNPSLSSQTNSGGRSEAIDNIIYTDFQQKNQWKLVILENFAANVDVSLEGLTRAAFGGVKESSTTQDLHIQVTSFLVQSVSLPSPVTIEYEEAGEIKFPKSLKRPGNVKITFLETETGLVWQYLNKWRKQIVSVIPVGISGATNFLLGATGQSFGSSGIKYMFSDNQQKAKKTAVLLLDQGQSAEKLGQYKTLRNRAAANRSRNISDVNQSIIDRVNTEQQRLSQAFENRIQAAQNSLVNNLVNGVRPGKTAMSNIFASKEKFPKIYLYGLNFANIDEVEFNYTDSGALMWSAEFSVDEIGAPSSQSAQKSFTKNFGLF